MAELQIAKRPGSLTCARSTAKEILLHIAKGEHLATKPQTTIRDCRRIIEKMLKTWKVAGKELVNSRAQLFESHLQQKRATCLVGFYNIIFGDPRLRKMEGSKLAARTAGLGKVSGPQRIGEWAAKFETSGRLPSPTREKKCSVFNLLSDPDVCAHVKTYLRYNKWASDPAKLQAFACSPMILETAERYAPTSDSRGDAAQAHGIHQQNSLPSYRR